MIVLDCQHISKSFDGVPILRDLAFSVEKGSKTALIGVNGAGKTTLMRIITGEMEPDSGQIVTGKEKIGYLAQDRQGITSSGTIYEILAESKREVIELEKELNRAEKELARLKGDQLAAAADRCEKMRQRFEELEGYAWEGQVRGIARGLGFGDEDLDRDVDSLSGGERMRVSLGCVLLNNADILLLDEPTNHLDISSIRWLENYLSRLKCTVIVISHDRYFLNRIVDTVVEIEYGRARTYKGNYTQYAEKKKQIRHAAMNAYLKQQEEIRHQEAVIKKLHQFNREKSVKRARSREKMLDKIERLEKPAEEMTGMNLRLQPVSVSGRDVLELTDVSARFGERTLFDNLNMLVQRGEHVALIGDNGSGKTTLLKMIVNAGCGGDERPGGQDSDLSLVEGCLVGGVIRTGTGVVIGYYDQAQELADGEATLFDEIRRDWPDMNDTRIRNTLAAFLFTGDDVFKQVKDLSGGEKGRLSLAKLMLSGANFLILDEPTNHLDILGKEVLEEALKDYEGTVLFVSHDRYFIGQTAERVWDLHDGVILDYPGGYDYYEEHVEERRLRAAGSVPGQQVDAGYGSDSAGTDSAGALSYEEQKRAKAAREKIRRELKACEEEIARLEERLAELNDRLNDPAIATNAGKLAEIALEQEKTDTQLMDEMTRWEELAQADEE